MRRREFIKLIAVSAVPWPMAVRAQTPAVPVVGWLRSTAAAGFKPIVAAFRQGLRESGFTEGKNIAIEFRWAEGHLDRLPGLAAELVSRGVDVIVCNNSATPAVMAATTSIPIVFVIGGDPVRTGYVRNLGHPGGNVTGVSFFAQPISRKRLGLLHDLVPKAEVIAVLLDASYYGVDDDLRRLKATSGTIGRKIIGFKVDREQNFESVFSAISQAGAGALLIGAGAFFNSRRRQLARLAALHKIPAMYNFRGFVEAGGFVSYGASQLDAYRRAAIYVSRILKGEKPGNMPVELPTKYELIINLKTAKALGLEISPNLLSIADDLIE
jgi:putative ABC transport system substrate-binding protein